MSIKDKTALLIDDDPELRSIVEKILVNAGMKVLQADSIESGLSAVNNFHPHLIFLDLNIGKESGFDFLTKFCKNSSFQFTPVVVLSAVSDRDSIHKAMSLGAKEYLTKPVQANLLIQKARKMLQSADFYSCDFVEPFDGCVTVPSSVVGGSTKGLLLESSIRVATNSVVSVECQIREEMGFLETPLLKSTTTLPKFLKKGEFVNDLKFVGLSEAQTRKLSEIIKRWHTK